MHEPERDRACERDEGQRAEHARDGERPDRAARQPQIEQAPQRPAGMRLPLRQRSANSGAEDEPRQREPDRCLDAVRGDDVQDDDRPERETHHATGGKETDAEGCVRCLRAGDRRPDGVESRRPEPADHEQEEDEPELGGNADQAQERRRHQDTDASDHSQPESSPSAPKTGCVTDEATQKTAIMRARAVDRIELHLKRREQRTQDRGHRIVDRVDERHEDCKSSPEDARLPDYVRHSRIMNSEGRTLKGRERDDVQLQRRAGTRAVNTTRERTPQSSSSTTATTHPLRGPVFSGCGRGGRAGGHTAGHLVAGHSHRLRARIGGDRPHLHRSRSRRR